MYQNTTSIAAARPNGNEDTRLAMLLVIKVRKTLRITEALHLKLYAEGRQIVRQVEKLQAQNSRFNKARITALNQRATQLRALSSTCVDIQQSSAQLLLHMEDKINADTTLTERCDLLNINKANRQGLTEADGLLKLVFEHALEDSATQGKNTHGYGPLHTAIALIMLGSTCKTQRGQRIFSERPHSRHLHQIRPDAKSA